MAKRRFTNLNMPFMDEEKSESLSSGTTPQSKSIDSESQVGDDKYFQGPLYYKGKVTKDFEYLPYKDAFRPSIS